MTFTQLNLLTELTSAISQQGYEKPTPVQIKAIPPILEGKDVVVTAQTGTGKTAGFTLPLLQRLNQFRLKNSTENHRGRKIQGLILTPTRELAAQVHESVRTYGKHLPFKSAVVFGGVSINPQIATLRRGIDILIATPGRLLDLMSQGFVDLSQIKIFILDEADRMLDMGFIHDIRRVLSLLPKQKQSLLFSATYSNEIKALTNKLLVSPTIIEVSSKKTTAERITQLIYPVDSKRKRELLSYIIGSKNWQQVLVFMRTKHGANRLAEQLKSDGLSTAAIHGNKSQGARTRALADFKQGKVRVLVATDIAARGLDIEKLPFVVNFELPNVPEDYVHRVGRTGRANQDGLAVSLVCVDEHKLLKDIERTIGFKIPQEIIEGFSPNLNIVEKPIQNRRGKRQQVGRNRPASNDKQPNKYRSSSQRRRRRS